MDAHTWDGQVEDDLLCPKCRYLEEITDPDFYGKCAATGMPISMAEILCPHFERLPIDGVAPAEGGHPLTLDEAAQSGLLVLVNAWNSGEGEYIKWPALCPYDGSYPLEVTITEQLLVVRQDDRSGGPLHPRPYIPGLISVSEAKAIGSGHRIVRTFPREGYNIWERQRDTRLWFLPVTTLGELYAMLDECSVELTTVVINGKTIRGVVIS